MNKGFTLIELLVVVLIIGILASIALPQYTKAVERSRMAEAVQILGDLATAQSIFYMQHNAFADGLDDLNDRGDIQLPGPSGSNWELEVGSEDGVQTMTRAGGMYDGAALRLTVRSNGAILKECLPKGHDDFCVMAETAGYGEEQAAAGANGKSGIPKDFTSPTVEQRKYKDEKAVKLTEDVAVYEFKKYTEAEMKKQV
jgi:prepilin-type N-terminal cleavage/methylation domain-containing protein